MINRIQYDGQLIGSFELEGERPEDHVTAVGCCALPLSKTRWLTVLNSRGFEGIDDGRSIIWQLRRNGPAGAVLKEGFFAKRIVDCDEIPIGDPVPDWVSVARYGHPLAFGVPKGARINGSKPANENIFVASWFRAPRVYHLKNRCLLWHVSNAWINHYLRLEWTQFRLADSEDDIEFLEAPGRLFQNGFGDPDGPACSVPMRGVNQGFNVVPLNEERSEWVSILHFHQCAVAAARFTFNAATARYEWTETSTPVGGDFSGPYSEGTIQPYNGSWLVALRTQNAGKYLRKLWPVTLFRTDDPFGEWGLPMESVARTHGPVGLHQMADGSLQITCSGGSPFASRNAWARNPLYMSELFPDDGMRWGEPRIIADVETMADVPETTPDYRVHFCKAAPHIGGSRQALHYTLDIHRYLRNDPTYSFRKVSPAQINATGVYGNTMIFEDEHPPYWEFGS